MKPEKLLLILMGAALTLLCLKFPVWGIMTVERKLDVYPIVSRDTIATIDEMASTLEDFSLACEIHQAAERDQAAELELELDYIAEDPEAITAASEAVDSATSDIYAALDRRKALAAQADWGLFKSMLVGGQAYTHSTWLCAPAYATFSTQINMGFTPTYDPTS